MKTSVISLAILVFAGTTIVAADWPQFLGPNRNGSSPETGLVTGWDASGPKVLWKVPGGPGCSQIIVAAGRAYVVVDRGKDECVLALESATGKTAWSHRLGITRKPGSTPAFDGGRLYVQSIRGPLVCLDADRGQVVWQNDLLQLFPRNLRTGWSHYGIMVSPLIEGDTVLTAPGRKGAGVVAFHKTTGKLIWQSTSDGAGFPSPVQLRIGGNKQAVFVTGVGVLAVQSDNGKELWRFPWENEGDAVVPTPLVIGEQVFLSSGPLGCVLLAPKDSGPPTVVWKKQGPSPVMDNYWATSVFHDKYLYGISGGAESNSPSLNCVEAATGKLVWSQESFGEANLTLANGHLYILTTNGELVVISATPKGYREKGRTKILEPASYVNAPTIAGKRLYARDNKSIICLDIAGN